MVNRDKQDYTTPRSIQPGIAAGDNYLGKINTTWAHKYEVGNVPSLYLDNEIYDNIAEK